MPELNRLRIEVSTLDTSAARAIKAMETGEDQGRYLSFETPEMLIKMLGGYRLSILDALINGKQMSVNELARRFGCDVHSVHNDTEKLIDAGVIEKKINGKLSCPYNEVICTFSIKHVA